jgi:hypothetical protein
MLLPILAMMLAAQETTGSVSGRVVDASTGQSVIGATVTVCHGRNVPEPKCDSLTARTNGDGVFRIDNLAAGPYDAYAAAAGHLEPQKRVPFSVSAGQEGSLIMIELQGAGSIRGRLLGADGKPVSGADIEALSQTMPHHFAVVSRSRTNAQGLYTLSKLRAGTYLVAVELRDSAIFFSPGTVDPDAAEPLQINNGQDLESGDIRLRADRLQAIAGKVEGIDESAQPGKLRLLLFSHSFEIDDARARSVEVKENGHFAFSNVAPGDYTIVLEAPRFGIRQPSDLAVQILQKQDVSIGDSDVTDLMLASLPLSTIMGRLELDRATVGELAALSPGVTLAEPFSIHEFRTALVAADGSFLFAACQPARYELRFRSIGGIYPAELNVNGKPASSRFIDLSTGGSTAVSVRYQRGTASVAGVLSKRHVAGVYFIPNGWTPDDWRDLRWASVRKDGTFSLPDLRPGRYSVVPADQTMSAVDIASLAQDALEFEVGPGERKQIEVKGPN